MRVIQSFQLHSLVSLIPLTFSCALQFQFRNVIVHNANLNAALPLIHRSLSSSSPCRGDMKVGFSFTSANAIKNSNVNNANANSKTKMAAVEYGKGAEIYPETSDKIIRLEDSFPNGIMPPTAIALSDMSSNQSLSDAETLGNKTRTIDDSNPAPSLSSGDSSSNSGSSSSNSNNDKRRGYKRKIVRGAISRILKLAAKSEEQALLESSSSSVNYYPLNPVLMDLLTDRPVDKTPSSAIALILLASGLVPPTQLLCVIFLSGYMTLLAFIAASSKTEGGVSGGDSDGGRRNTMRTSMPSLPPQGHVPSLISNPLGRVLTDSRMYRIWLRLGTVFGFIGPLIAVGWYRFFVRDVGAASLVAKSVFLLCCQASTDAIARRMLVPLPLRILIPVAYTAFRLPPLYEWLMVPTPLGGNWIPGIGMGIGRILAIINVLYWGVHLFGFLLPIATMRYLRSYFFCVEAAEVTMREGGEGNIGLLP